MVQPDNQLNLIKFKFDWIEKIKKKKINGNVLLYPLNKVTKVKLNKEAKGLFRSRVRREWT